MAISKIILNGVTQMDVTGKTVTAVAMRNGVTALKNDGTDVIGNIPDITLPSASSSTSSGTSKATITPTSSDQYLNIPTGYLDTAQYYTIAAASGGASNFVTGTFKGTTTGAAYDITLDYSGNGYPIAVLIFVAEGALNPTGTYNTTIQRRAMNFWVAIKEAADVAPTYTGSSDDSFHVYGWSKSSTSVANSYSGSYTQKIKVANNVSSGDTNTSVVRLKNKTSMSVFIASDSYGFMANIDYKYVVVYSS